jgi:hypothetical protein
MIQPIAGSWQLFSTGTTFYGVHFLHKLYILPFLENPAQKGYPALHAFPERTFAALVCCIPTSPTQRICIQKVHKAPQAKSAAGTAHPRRRRPTESWRPPPPLPLPPSNSTIPAPSPENSAFLGAEPVPPPPCFLGSRAVLPRQARPPGEGTGRRSPACEVSCDVCERIGHRRMKQTTRSLGSAAASVGRSGGGSPLGKGSISSHIPLACKLPSPWPRHGHPCARG